MHLKQIKLSSITIQVVLINVITLLLSLVLLILRLNKQYSNDEVALAKEKLSLIWTELLNEDTISALYSLRQKYLRDLDLSDQVYGIRIADENNHTVLLDYPMVWNHYFYSKLDFNNSIQNLENSYRLRATSVSKNIKTDLIVHSFLINKYYVQVITSMEQRKNLLISILQNGLAIIVAIMSISFMITHLIIIKVLSPLHGINKITEAIMKDQRIQERLSENGSEEFIRMQKNFNTMLDVIERQVNRLKQAAINIGHDIRTPLTRVRNKLELLQEKMNDKDSIIEIDSCLESIQDLTIFTSKILDLSEIESGLVRIPDHDINVWNTIEDVIDMYEYLAESHEIILEYNIDKSISFRIEPIRLKQLVSNLLDNAIKYTPKKRKVYVSVFMHKTNIVIEIKDEGIGIAKEDISNIWIPAWKKQMTDGDQMSTGFGLSIVESIVQAYNGNISVETVPNEGSRFRLNFKV